MEQFYSFPKELAENCDFEKREEAIIRDIFFRNRLDDDIPRELLRDTVELERALSIAVNMELGHQNQQRISSKNNSGVNAIQQFTRFRCANNSTQQRDRKTFNCVANGPCRNSGQIWTATQLRV